MSLDLSDDSDETETLGMDKVYAVYSRYGGQLGGCLASNGARLGEHRHHHRRPERAGEGREGQRPDVGRATWAASGASCSKMQFPKINGPRTRAEFDIGV